MFFITGSATSQQRKTKKKCAYAGEWIKETMTCV